MTNEEFGLRQTSEAEEDEKRRKGNGEHSLAINIALIIGTLSSILFADGILRAILLVIIVALFMVSKMDSSSSTMK
jgi:hypothetical protein